MFARRQMIIPVMLILAFGFALALQSAMGDGISLVYQRGGRAEDRRIESRVVYHSHGDDKITSERRDGDHLDDWIERGASSVTDSPKYKKGIRLATWATHDRNEYDYALASAVYSFQVPDRARSIKIKIRYDGEPGRYSVDDDTAGRIWIRAKYPVDRYEKSYSGERNYSDQPLYGDYGDTFVLRKKRHNEEIRISAREHVVDGMMELHVIAEGGQRLDVDYIEVETYRSLPEIKVVTREYKNYVPRPWYHHTYFCFYTGPVFHFDGGRYVTYTYPRHHNIVEIRGSYGRYLREYQVKHPQINLSWSGKLNLPNIVFGGLHGIRVNKWTPGHEKTRKAYVKDYEKMQNPVSVRAFRKQIENVIAEHRKPSDGHAGRRQYKDEDDRDYERGRDRGR